MNMGKAKRKSETFAILATDIRNFSSVARKNDPDEDIPNFIDQYIALIHSLRPKITPKDEIKISNFLGDGFLIFFRNNLDAVKFALELRKNFKGLCKQFSGVIHNIERLGVGTGLHIGNVSYGTFGYPQKRYRTGISHHVNMTFRLEKKAAKWEVLASEDFYPYINNKTILTCKDEIFPKGVLTPIWPYSIARMKTDNEQRICCDHCERIRFCKFNWELGIKFRSPDPYGDPVSGKHTGKYLFKREECDNKILCAFPDERVKKRNESLNLSEGICGGCDPICKKEPTDGNEPHVIQCDKNWERGRHHMKYRACCDDCNRFNTCLFNLHRGKNREGMVCCEDCTFFFDDPCPWQNENTSMPTQTSP